MRTARNALRRAPALASTALLLLGGAAFQGNAAAGTHVHDHSSTTTWRYSDDDSDGFSYVLIRRDGNSTWGSGEMNDFDAARRLRNDRGTDLLITRVDDQRYVIRDPTVVARAFELMGPVEAMGRRQSEMGRRQSLVGREQSALGARQGQLAAGIARRAARGESTADLERDQRDLEVQMARLQVMQEKLSREQEVLSRKQEPLSSQQQDLGEQQARLGHQLQEDMRRLVREAIDAGKAERVDD